jgi:hypothetical protein
LLMLHFHCHSSKYEQVVVLHVSLLTAKVWQWLQIRIDWNQNYKCMEKYLKYGILGIKHGQECWKYYNEENRLMMQWLLVWKQIKEERYATFMCKPSQVLCSK